MKVISFNETLNRNNDLVVRALDALGYALANEEHHWTAEEKLLYEKAIERLTGIKQVQL